MRKWVGCGLDLPKLSPAFFVHPSTQPTRGDHCRGPFAACVDYAHRCHDAGDYSFAFVGLQVVIDVPTPVGVEVGLGASLSQLAFSKQGAIDPAVYPNLGLPSTFRTPRYVRACF